MEPSEQTTAHPRRALIPRWAPIAVAATLVAGAAATLPLLLPRGADVSVPNVRGLDAPVARSRLGEAGLVMAYGDERFSAVVPAGGVIDQDPAPGALVSRRDTVTVIVSAGSEEFGMPDVLGMRISEARGLLEGRGLRVDAEPVASDEPSGTVLSSVPSPGSTVRTSEPVRLTVSASRESSAALRPYPLGGTSFVIDPEELPGASRTVSQTSDPALDVARRLRSLLEASGSAVTVTRSALDAPEAADVAHRAVRASAASCTAVIGLSVRETGEGVEVLSLAPVADGSAVYIPSADLARRIADALRGSRITAPVSAAASDPVLSAVRAPGVRIILGSAEVSEDRVAFRDPGWADRIARAVYRGIGEAFTR